MQVNVSGSIVIGMAEPVHDLMQWDAGLGQQGCVCMPENMRRDVQRKLDDLLDPVDLMMTCQWNMFGWNPSISTPNLWPRSRSEPRRALR
jgi:hypothetical protein